MVTKVNTHQAKTPFSRLVEKALWGEEVIVAKHGKPLLHPVSIEGSKRPVELRPTARAGLFETDHPFLP